MRCEGICLYANDKGRKKIEAVEKFQQYHRVEKALIFLGVKKWPNDKKYVGQLP